MSSVIKVDQIQLADGSTPTAADLGLNTSGSVIQVVHQGAYVDVVGTGSFDVFSFSITPRYISSKVLIIVNFQFSTLDTSGNEFGFIIKRNGSEIASSGQSNGLLIPGSGVDGAGNLNQYANFFRSATVLDTPASTSSTTYTLAKKQLNGSANVRVGQNGYNSTGTENNFGQSMMTLMEIAG